MTQDQIEAMESLIQGATDDGEGTPLQALVLALAEHVVRTEKLKLLHDVAAAPAKASACTHTYADFDDKGREAPYDKHGKIAIQGNTRVKCKECGQPPKSSIDCGHVWRDMSDGRGSRCMKCDSRPPKQGSLLR